jgi:hypothetical protein
MVYLCGSSISPLMNLLDGRHRGRPCVEVRYCRRPGTVCRPRTVCRRQSRPGSSARAVSVRYLANRSCTRPDANGRPAPAPNRETAGQGVPASVGQPGLIGHQIDIEPVGDPEPVQQLVGAGVRQCTCLRRVRPVSALMYVRLSVVSSPGYRSATPNPAASQAPRDRANTCVDQLAGEIHDLARNPRRPHPARQSRSQGATGFRTRRPRRPISTCTTC